MLRFEEQKKIDYENINVRIPAETSKLLEEYAYHLKYKSKGPFVRELIERSIAEVISKDRSFQRGADKAVQTRQPW